MKNKPLYFILLLGVVSLLADVTYEGARSLTGPFLSVLGASGAAVGIIVGAGEMVGYGIRVASGYAADKKRWYWQLTIIGYGLNLLAPPLLALANSWEMAAVFIVLERLGKGLRTPARDTLLSYATHKIGRGWGFGIHEALDQVGALLGPLLMAGVFFYTQRYAPAFACLAIPALGALIVLMFAKRIFPHPERMEKVVVEATSTSLPRTFWIYVAGVCCIGAGFIDFALLSYHFEKSALLFTGWIPVLYAMTMGIDGLAALGMGKLFDRKGIVFLALITILTSFFAPLILLSGTWGVLLGLVLWGIGLGSQESILRSYVAKIIPPKKRAFAYGILALCFGFSWFLGSSIIGLLYDHSLLAAALFSMGMQILGALLFIRIK